MFGQVSETGGRRPRPTSGDEPLDRIPCISRGRLAGPVGLVPGACWHPASKPDELMIGPTVVSLQVGLPREVGTVGTADPTDRVWRSGIFKDQVNVMIRLGRINLEGDGQADLKHHGGPDKAVCVYPAAHYPYWRSELGNAALEYGAFGENFTVQGMDETRVAIGDVYAVGSAVVQVSQPRQPCWKLARRWRVPDLALRVQQTGFTGWYFRVLEEGDVAPGLTLRLLERSFGQWTVARANQVMHRDRSDRNAAAALAECPALSVSWRDTLRKRAEAGENPDIERRIAGPIAD